MVIGLCIIMDTEKKNNIELPQLIKTYKKISINKNNNSQYHGFSYNKKY